ncbi:hypothetical protein ACK8HJ_16740 [Vreelandella titanicae]|jgi:hypothetical protein|uniref:hypothetical protein n=1 Tax=Vreelandella titanicae TaxID=664683 RepID=UPI0005878B90|nr:hypothetical protein [Halomonas titanicae]NVE90633.1 hypothetical protein [Halomonas titanicae]|tara:strand:+ start:1212 stop:1583 length:372 start_codon:yes stop_codon:yes gene_type:complete
MLFFKNNLVMFLILYPAVLYAAEIDIEGVDIEKERQVLRGMDVPKSGLDQMIERAASSFSESISGTTDEQLQCMMRCDSQYQNNISTCSSLSRDGFPGYLGSPHDKCTSEAYNVNSSCQTRCP